MSFMAGCEPSALPLTGKHFPLASPHGECHPHDSVPACLADPFPHGIPAGVEPKTHWKRAGAGSCQGGSRCVWVQLQGGSRCAWVLLPRDLQPALSAGRHRSGMTACRNRHGRNELWHSLLLRHELSGCKICLLLGP